MERDKNGFTLIELLAVIMVIAVIAVITIPTVFNILENSRKGTMIDSAYGYVRGVDVVSTSLMTSDNRLDGIIDVSRLNDIVDYTGNMPSEGYVELYNDEIVGYSLKFGDYVVTMDRSTGEVTAIKNGSIVSVTAFANSCANPNYNPTDESLFRYRELSDNTVIITGYSLGSTDIKIPCSINGARVISIDRHAFENDQLTSVMIPDSVTSIGSSAFASNQLTSITIPDSVTSIGLCAFENNQLTDVKIGTGLTSIDMYTFRNNKLSSIVIPGNVTSIGSDAFSDNMLINLVLSNGITSIGATAFMNNQLTSVVIPESVTSIGNGAFFKHIKTGNSDIYSDNSNSNLTTIYNNTGRSFNWKYITDGSNNATFVTGIIPHAAGNITVTTSN